MEKKELTAEQSRDMMTATASYANKLHDGDDIINILNKHSEQWVKEHGEDTE